MLKKKVMLRRELNFERSGFKDNLTQVTLFEKMTNVLQNIFFFLKWHMAFLLRRLYKRALHVFNNLNYSSGLKIFQSDKHVSFSIFRNQNKKTSLSDIKCF